MTGISSILTNLTTLHCCLCNFLPRNTNGHLVKKAVCVYVSLQNAVSHKREQFLYCGFLQTFNMVKYREELQDRKQQCPNLVAETLHLLICPVLS